MISTAGGFIRSDPGVPHPNIQFHFFPSQVVDHGRKAPELEAYQVRAGYYQVLLLFSMKLKDDMKY